MIFVHHSGVLYSLCFLGFHGWHEALYGDGIGFLFSPFLPIRFDVTRVMKHGSLRKRGAFRNENSVSKLFSVSIYESIEP